MTSHSISLADWAMLAVQGVNDAGKKRQGGVVSWTEMAAIADVVSAAVVLVTLVYLAVQVRDTKRAMSDQSRIYRANSINSLVLASCTDQKLREAQLTAWGVDDYYRKAADAAGESYATLTTREFACGYYFWMWWGQYASSTEARDREELASIIRKLGNTPGMRSHWENSPISRPLIDRDFARFVDEILDVNLDGPSNLEPLPHRR